MNERQFKILVSHICLAGAVVASWSLTQEMAGLSPFIVMTNIFSLNSGKIFKENSIKVQEMNEKVGCPIMCMGTINNAILFIETTTMLGIRKPISRF